MKIEYDKKADALYLAIQAKYVAKSKEIQDGVVVDFDEKGKVIGFEILDVSKRYKHSDISNFAVKNLTLETTRKN